MSEWPIKPISQARSLYRDCRSLYVCMAEACRRGDVASLHRLLAAYTPRQDGVYLVPWLCGDDECSARIEFCNVEDNVLTAVIASGSSRHPLACINAGSVYCFPLGLPAGPGSPGPARLPRIEAAGGGEAGGEELPAEVAELLEKIDAGEEG